MTLHLPRRRLLGAALLAPLAAFAAPPRIPASVWQQLEHSRWIADGSAKAPRVVYVFTDANCPFCTKFWDDARPWVDGGKVQLRHLMVGIIAPTSPGKAAALLSAPDPSATLRAYEGIQVGQATQTIASGHPQPLAGGRLEPLRSIPPAIKAQLEANQQLMASLGIGGTPGIVWQEPTGAVRARSGAPDEALPQMLGPR